MTAQLDVSREGAVVTLEMRNPPLNIVSAEMRPLLLTALQEIASDPTVRTVILTGAGERAFCAGADLNEEAGLTPDTVRTFLEEDCAIYDAVEALPVPVIAAINGHCMGGGLELALACDIRIAAEDAKHRAAGVTVGLVVSTTRMTRLIGMAAAKDVLLTGRTFDGTEAFRLGLASAAVSRPEARATAMRWAQEIASRAPLAVRRTKQAIHESSELPFGDAMSRELDHFAALSATRDHKHAIDAFFRRQAPEFLGH